MDYHEKNRNYYKYFKKKLRREDSQLVSATNRLRLDYYYEEN